MEKAEDLNYIFNSYLFAFKHTSVLVENFGDRQRATRWKNKLVTCNKSIEEMKLRNDFMHYLIINIQSRNFQPPFTENPPHGPLPKLANLLPGGGMPYADKSFDLDQPQEKPKLYQHSPDGGAFLAAQPIPTCGAICYLAVVSRPQKKDEA